MPTCSGLRGGSKRNKAMLTRWTCTRRRENWNQPTKPWGFWTSDKNRLMWEEERRPSVEKVMGRLSPYETQ